MSVEQRIRPTPFNGAVGASFKYDVLTAIGAYACAGDLNRQRVCLRFVTLLTARYDWKRDILNVGQREIASLWSVNERTVKREMARLREIGWLVLKRPAARGRVAQHGLGLDTVMADTSPSWAIVGPDFLERMAGPKPVSDIPDRNVVPFRRDYAERGGSWADIEQRLLNSDPAGFAAWIAPLHFERIEEGRLILSARSSFHASFVRTHHAGAILAHAVRVRSDIVSVEISVK
ncbi:DnaA N-terminal domain-containing protein [Palleronia aestuarii]|uniref:DnaA N-terminal domain-containing protein n=1 Tax=Palleronia aestuarii TaxID=568105 RepID=A0A2W7MR14_9RHOB|nr:DnaA N-terminal domain-containing protein [Palleronia aestuarii]PZX10328.1 DnaA N-terminal domain-containing protein [Palleronia aestuarii]